MAYDESLARRIHAILANLPGVSEKKMFGGLAFLVHGNMSCGVVRYELMVRVGPEVYDDALSHPHAREMDFTGRPLKGFVYVSCEGITSDGDLEDWVARGVEYARALPAK